ncbi:MAG TPA: HemK2/MTQ2 family protein methyltransferase [Candidatus Nanoarchaeia archaeon]|nr:HemK2/MTQ2 family protein methyltransferase [Candidatus Nanoarchaeia archaeon]
MQIYPPAEDSFLLQKLVRKYALGRVLDLGTGSGIQALTAAASPLVKEILAADINPEALEKLNQEIKLKKFRKIKTIFSDLFSAIEGKFDTIIFNPPYLPQDKIGKELIADPALYGGKKGWELSARFFQEASKFLVPNGKILFLFSSLTNKPKIEEIIAHNLLESKLLAQERLPLFEELYLYLIEKSKILRELERKGIEEIQYLSHGKRGNVFTGILDRSKLVKTHFSSKKDPIKVAIKIKRKESQAQERIENETKWLKILNPKGIGPKLLFSGEDFLVYEFVEGTFFPDWIKDQPKPEIKRVLSIIFEQCYLLDQLGLNKEEMHRPLKHILLDKNNFPVMIDFERITETKKPHNLTQFIEFISRIKSELEKKNFQINPEGLRASAKLYKKKIAPETFKSLLVQIN